MARKVLGGASRPKRGQVIHGDVIASTVQEERANPREQHATPKSSPIIRDDSLIFEFGRIESFRDFEQEHDGKLGDSASDGEPGDSFHVAQEETSSSGDVENR